MFSTVIVAKTVPFWNEQTETDTFERTFWVHGLDTIFCPLNQAFTAHLSSQYIPNPRVCSQHRVKRVDDIPELKWGCFCLVGWSLILCFNFTFFFLSIFELLEHEFDTPELKSWQAWRWCRYCSFWFAQRGLKRGSICCAFGILKPILPTRQWYN